MIGAEKQVERQTPLRRYGDITVRSSNAHIARLAFLLASVLIILASISLVFIGRIASKEADRIAIADQQLLLENALDNWFVIIRRDQLSLARWDKAVRKISLRFDEDFVVDEFIDSLWFDFGLDRNLLVGPNNNILVNSRGEEVQFGAGVLAETDSLYRFVEEARAQYFKNRITLAGGYGQQSISSGTLHSHTVHGFLELDDKVSLVHAMAVVPDDGNSVLPDGNPVILISALYLDSELIEELNAQLAFSHLKFGLQSAASASLNHHPVTSPAGEALGVFSWQGNLPGGHIWETVIPVIAVLAVMLGALAFIIAWRIGKLTVSLAKSEEQNRFLAMHDTLSGLANRLQFMRALTAALERLPEVPFSLVQCDLDKFKQVNDTHGHGAGDTVIKVVAKRLTAAVQGAGLVCRVGGDEFVILLDLVERSALETVAARIIADVCQPIEVEHGVFARVGVSLGIATAPSHGDIAESLMAVADSALYQAKEQGRNRAVFVEDVLEQYVG